MGEGCQPIYEVSYTYLEFILECHYLMRLTRKPSLNSQISSGPGLTVVRESASIMVTDGEIDLINRERKKLFNFL